MNARRNSSGLLALGIGAVDDGEVVAVMKLEREQGVRLRIERTGRRATVNLQFLRDLTLTAKLPDGTPLELKKQFQEGGLAGALGGKR